MSKRTIDEYRESLDYLPDFLKDFHDQKDAFKCVHETIRIENHDYCKDISWVEGQCYVIDIFLWWAARYGYKLQKTKANVEFRDLDEDIRANNSSAMEAMKVMFSKPMTTTNGKEE